MKMNQKYALLSFITAVAVMAMSTGSLSFAQAITPVTCNINVSSILPNQAAIFTASGGNGFYTWSGTNLNITNASGNQFAVSYPNAGTYTITVTSAGLSSSCTMTVAGAVVSGALVCSPATQNVTLGQNATFAATGGTGIYVWSSPDLIISNPNGVGFSANYASTGLKTMSVTSGGITDTCAVNVLTGAAVPPVIPPVTPGLPAAGGGYGK